MASTIFSRNSCEVWGAIVCYRPSQTSVYAALPNMPEVIRTHVTHYCFIWLFGVVLPRPGSARRGAVVPALRRSDSRTPPHPGALFESSIISEVIDILQCRDLNCVEDLADDRGNTQGTCSDPSTKPTAYSQSPRLSGMFTTSTGVGMAV